MRCNHGGFDVIQPGKLNEMSNYSFSRSHVAECEQLLCIWWHMFLQKSYGVTLAHIPNEFQLKMRPIHVPRTRL
jgi:hypothetical protein